MKVYKFNEMSEYKEYDEYSYIDMDVLENWKSELDKVDDILDDIKHDAHQYSDFIREYVVFVDEKWVKNLIFIPSEISLNRTEYTIGVFFNDAYGRYKVNSSNIANIKNISEVANEDPNLFLKLYNFYIKEKRAPYMDVFGKDEFKHILDADTKYNL